MATISISSPFWEAILQTLARGADRWLFAPAGTHVSSAGTRLLARNWDEVPAHHVPQFLSRWKTSVLVRRLPAAEVAPPTISGLTPYHQTAVLSVGVRETRGYLSGWHWANGLWTRLDSLEIVGPGLPVRDLRQRTASAPASDGTIPERWSRTAGALSPGVWRRFRALSFAVVGCGRMGSLLAHQLALLGAGRLTLIDAQDLEGGNLDATWGVEPKDVGRPKVQSVGQALHDFRPDLNIRTIATSVRSRQARESLRDSEVIISAVDHDVARLIVADTVSRYLRVHLDVGTGVFRDNGRRLMGADVRLLLPGMGCLACVGGLRNQEESRYEILAPPGALRRGQPQVWWQQRAGSLVTINAVAAGAALQVLFDLLDSRVSSSRWQRLLWQEDGRIASESSSHAPTTPCRICQALGQGD